MKASALTAPGAAPGRGIWQRLLVFVPARRNWPGGARGGIGPTTAVPYVALQADGSCEQATATVAQLPRARVLELVFDSLDVHTTTIDAPRLGEAKLRQALPNLLEERLLADAADCHFAFTPSRETAPAAVPEAAAQASAGGALRLSVAAVDRATLSRVLEAFHNAQWQPRAAYSEIYTLPPPHEGTFAMRIERGRGLLRTGLDQACVFDLDEGAAALSLARRQLGLRRLKIYGEAGAAQAALRSQELPWEAAAGPLDAQAVADAVNLLQGSYAPVGGFGLAGRLFARLGREGAWKAPAAWAGLCALIAVGGLNVYWFKLDAQFREIRGAMQRSFRDAFPNESVVNELAQAQRDVAALRARAGRSSSDDFTVLNAQAAHLLASAPVGVVAGIDYSGGSYTLHFVPGTLDDAGLRNQLQAVAMGQGLALHFAGDGSAQLAPAGTDGQ